LQEDLADYKIGDLNLILLIVGGGLLKYLGSGVGFYPIQALVAFLIGWGMFQAFEGDIGGGDVRLLTVAALFLNLIQLLAGISLAAAAGLLIGQRLRLRKVPFGALLIVALWLSFGVVRF
jgi:Flp pilus assembly protein protease CpaA